ncbi:PASTA domain-containing protein [Streptomyces sp. NPDC006184]|uniref:PASTA domain-containing protein n=1 Tax=Streptomyces sp. NPDC006184 TaxID=3155455 RepID=UPI0033A3EC9E
MEDGVMGALRLQANDPATISWGHVQVLLCILLSAVVAIGILLVLARRAVPSRTASSNSIVRSWIAMALVLGLVAFCAVAFAVRDTTLRSTLIGALAAAVGSAVAFYFSGKVAEDARKDVLSAAFGGEEVVPDLVECTKDQAAVKLGGTTLKLELAPDSGPSAAPAAITRQDPARGATVPRGTAVKVTFP